MTDVYNNFKPTFKYYADYYQFLELNDERVYNYIIESVKKKLSNPNINDLVNMTIKVYYKQVKVRFLQDKKYLLLLFEQHFLESDIAKSLENINLIIVKAKYELTFEDCSLILNNYPSIKTYIEQSDANNNYLLKKLKEIIDLENEDEKVEENFNYDDFIATDNIDAYLKEIIRLPVLSWKEQLDLAIKMVEGDKKAREELIKSNLRLVVSIAVNYVNRGIELLDLIESGNEGLLKAANHYDPKLGYKFTTYAAWWIRQSIQRNIYNEGRTVRIPVYYSLKISKFLKELSELELKLGKEISFKEALSNMNYTKEELMSFFIHTGEIKSLNSKVAYSNEETEKELQEFIPDEFNIENQVLDREFLDGAVNIMQKILNDRLLMILIFRWGLDGEDPQTLEEIGNIMGLTKERIRQLQEKAIKKLNKNRALKAYINDEKIPRISKIVKSKADSLFKLSGKELKKISTLLSPKEQELLEKRFGKDLTTTINYNMTLNELSYIYRVIYPKIKKMLSENQISPLESAIVSKQDLNIKKQSNKENKNVDNEILKNDSGNIKKLLNGESLGVEDFDNWFNYLKKYLVVSDALILCLYLGFYIRKFTIQELAILFETNEKTMLLKIKEILETLKQQHEDENIQKLLLNVDNII